MSDANIATLVTVAAGVYVPIGGETQIWSPTGRLLQTAFKAALYEMISTVVISTLLIRLLKVG